MEVKLVNEFLNYLHCLNYSKQTIHKYGYQLVVFFTFVRQYWKLEIDLNNFTEQILLKVKKCDVYAYMYYLNVYKNISARTRRDILTPIRVFYDWLYIKFPKKENPIKNIVPPIRVEKEYKILTEKQAIKIQSIFTIENDKNPLRNNAIMSLFLSSGMRLGELYRINICDINFNNNTIRIIGKGNKERIAYFDNFCKNKILKYLSTRKDYQLNEPLFLKKDNQRLSKGGIASVCKKAFYLLGLGKGYSTHSLRHTAATLFYKRSGNNIYLTRDFLGHSNIEATQMYVHVGEEDKRKLVNSNPINKHLIELKGWGDDDMENEINYKEINFNGNDFDKYKIELMGAQIETILKSLDFYLYTYKIFHPRRKVARNSVDELNMAIARDTYNSILSQMQNEAEQSKTEEEGIEKNKKCFL